MRRACPILGVYGLTLCVVVISKVFVGSSCSGTHFWSCVTAPCTRLTVSASPDGCVQEMCDTSQLPAINTMETAAAMTRCPFCTDCPGFVFDVGARCYQRTVLRAFRLPCCPVDAEHGFDSMVIGHARRMASDRMAAWLVVQWFPLDEFGLQPETCHCQTPSLYKTRCGVVVRSTTRTNPTR